MSDLPKAPEGMKTKVLKIRVTHKKTVTFSIQKDAPVPHVLIYEGVIYHWVSTIKSYTPATVFNMDAAMEIHKENQPKESKIIKP